MKLIKIQKIACLLGYWTVSFIAAITIFQLVRHKASWRLWFCFVPLLLVMYLVALIIPPDMTGWIRVLITNILMGAVALGFVKLQEKVQPQKEE